MLMLDAMKGVKPRKKTHLGSVLGGVLILAGIGAGVPSAMKQGEDCRLDYAIVDGRRIVAPKRIVMTNGGDAVLFFSKAYYRLAIGNPTIAATPAEPPKEKTNQVLINARAVGQTTLTYWCDVSDVVQIPIVVTPDLTTLGDALRQVHSSITVEMASDREAVVLRGKVPDTATKRAAGDLAEQYLRASGDKLKTQGQSVQAGAATVVINTSNSGRSIDSAGADVSRAEVTESYQSGQVINLIEVTAAAPLLEARIKVELEVLGVANVDVRRLTQDIAPNDREDVFIILGEVPSLDLMSQAGELALRVLPGSADENKSATEKARRRIINRLTVGGKVATIESVIEAAIQALGCPKVTVRHVVSTEFPGDGDIVVLEGTVPTQTHLVRAVTLAGRIFQQQEVIKRKRANKIDVIREMDPSGQSRTIEKEPKLDASSDDIKVVADESGALRKSDARVFGGGGSAVGNILGAGSVGTGSGANNMQRLLENQIDANIGRAKALEMAEGRVLSFLTVEDLPAVRIDIKLYEINRTALLSWNSGQSLAVTDFQTGSTLRDPTYVQNPITGDFQANPGTTPTDNPDVKNVLSFLGGGLANRLQISGDHVQIDSLLALLEREGIARSLSSPQLTVLSGELAFFGVGGSVPIERSFTTQTTTQTETVERAFGISLSVRPLVEEDGMITLDVIPSVSQPDALLTRLIRESTGQPLSTTAFQERSLRTSARLRDGATLLVGGLTSRTRADDSGQTPFLNKIPILGSLFKSYSYDDQDRELVIVVNPVIVREAPRDAPLWAFPDAKELMQSIQPKAPETNQPKAPETKPAGSKP